MLPRGTAVVIKVNFWACETMVTEDVDDSAGKSGDTGGLGGILVRLSLIGFRGELSGMPSGVGVVVAPNGRRELGYDRPEALGNPSVTSTE